MSRFDFSAFLKKVSAYSERRRSSGKNNGYCPMYITSGTIDRRYDLVLTATEGLKQRGVSATTKINFMELIDVTYYCIKSVYNDLELHKKQMEETNKEIERIRKILTFDQIRRLEEEGF